MRAIFGQLSRAATTQVQRPITQAVLPALTASHFSSLSFGALKPSTPVVVASHSVDPTDEPADKSKVPLSAIALNGTLAERLQAEFNITHLYPVQARVFQPYLENRDVVVRSRTGTGKTLAFALPVVHSILSRNLQARPTKPLFLVLTPTRELCKQIETEFRRLSPHHVRVTAVYGGVPIEPQRRQLEMGVHVLVATPGRLMDLASNGGVELSSVTSVVLDESDEMLRMGFQQDVESILSQTPAEKQITMFSATMPHWIRSIVTKFTEKPVYIDVVGDSSQKIPESIQHYAIHGPSVESSDFADFIGEIIQRYCPNDPIILFTERKSQASKLAAAPVLQRYCQGESLHGDVSQAGRDAIMRKFRNRQVQLLIATDVAARGLDINDVGMVIQAQPAQTTEAFIHRAGRTGRAGKGGINVICVTPESRGEVNTFLRQARIKVSMVSSTNTESKQSSSAVEAYIKNRSNDPSVTKPNSSLEALASRLQATHGANTAMFLLNCFAPLIRGANKQPRSLLSGLSGRVAVSFTSPKGTRLSALAVRSMVSSKAPAINLLGFGEGLPQTAQSGPAVLFDVSVTQLEELNNILANDPDLSVSVVEQIPHDLFGSLVATFGESRDSSYGRSGPSGSRPSFNSSGPRFSAARSGPFRPSSFAPRENRESRGSSGQLDSRPDFFTSRRPSTDRFR